MTHGPGAARAEEVTDKLSTVRAVCEEHELAAVRLRGVDWFAWATAGGSSVVLLTAETGAAEVLVTASGAWVLTDEIELVRLTEEEVPEGLSLWAAPWADAAATDAFVTAQVGGGPVASDRPEGREVRLPDALVGARWSLVDGEVARYCALGRDAAEVATDVLLAARPGWSGQRLAGAAAAALWERGIHPALTLVGGERRLPRHRHPTPTSEPLGGVAMLVLCGRRAGLYANLTRSSPFAPSPSRSRSAMRPPSRWKRRRSPPPSPGPRSVRSSRPSRPPTPKAATSARSGTTTREGPAATSPGTSSPSLVPARSCRSATRWPGTRPYRGRRWRTRW